MSLKWVPLLIILEALGKTWNLLSYDDILNEFKNDFINLTCYTNELAQKYLHGNYC